MKKLRSNRGESLVETLVSTVIIMFCFIFMVTSIVCAAKINAKYDKEGGKVGLEYTKSDGTDAATLISEGAAITLTPTSGGDALGKGTVVVKSSNGYVYYEKAG